MAQYCTYQDGIQFCYLQKIFCQRLNKTWYYSKKTCLKHENIRNREKTWKKHETHAKLHLHAWSLLCFPSKL